MMPFHLVHQKLTKRMMSRYYTPLSEGLTRIQKHHTFRLSTRGKGLLIAFASIVVALWIWFTSRHMYRKADWTVVHDREKNLPQHNLNLPLPEGRGGRYVRFSGQIRGLGWNNVLGEM
jgi:hypothetical protein